jgi:hypothetical protein
VATHDLTRPTGAGIDAGGERRRTLRRLATETKSFFKTSEFFAFLVAAIAILIAGNTIEGKDGGADYFAADKVWLYITLLTIGYMVSRGIAKSGTRDPYWDERGDRNADQ